MVAQQQHDPGNSHLKFLIESRREKHDRAGPNLGTISSNGNKLKSEVVAEIIDTVKTGGEGGGAFCGNKIWAGSRWMLQLLLAISFRCRRNAEIRRASKNPEKLKACRDIFTVSSPAPKNHFANNRKVGCARTSNVKRPPILLDSDYEVYRQYIMCNEYTSIIYTIVVDFRQFHESYSLLRMFVCVSLELVREFHESYGEGSFR